MHKNYYTFIFVPKLIVRIQNPSVLDVWFKEFMISSFRDLVRVDENEMLLCLVRAVR